MASWFAKPAPARVSTDVVAPIRYWDDSAALKSLVVFSLWRYDVALDATKLYDSLERLVSMKGWRKLGARLRKNVRSHFVLPFLILQAKLTRNRAMGRSNTMCQQSSQRSDRV